MYRVLRPFNYSTDGINAHWLEKGTELDIVEEFVKGLIEAGYIEPASNEPVSDDPEVVEEEKPTRRSRRR